MLLSLFVGFSRQEYWWKGGSHHEAHSSLLCHFLVGHTVQSFSSTQKKRLRTHSQNNLMLPAVLPWSKRRSVLNQRAKVFHQYRQGWVQSNSEVWDDLVACGSLGTWVLLNSLGRKNCLSVEVSEAVAAVGTDQLTVLTPHTTLGPSFQGAS